MYIDNGDGQNNTPLGSFDTSKILPELLTKLSMQYIKGLYWNSTLHKFEIMKIGIYKQIIHMISKDTSLATITTTTTSNSYLLPGLMDIQINGFNGIDFNTLGSLITTNTNDSNTDSDELYQPVISALVTIATALASHGITSFIPTLITNPFSILESAVKAIDYACTHHKLLQSMIKGIHLEGPFISSTNGYRGCHKQEYCLEPDYTIIKQLQKVCNNRICLITLAPELPGSIPFIKQAIQNNIKIAIGHTNATDDEIQLAVEAGATLSTHLGNGIASMLPRHPNPIWSQLSHDNLWASIIADGKHLSDSILKIILRTKLHNVAIPNDNNNNNEPNPYYSKVILISDAVPLANMPPGNYNADSLGGEVVLSNDQRLYLKNDPKLLAGSILTLDKAIEYLLKANNILNIIDWEEKLYTIWNLASYNPSVYLSSVLKQPIGMITLGSPADIVVVNIDKVLNNFDIQQVWKEGNILYEKK